MKRTDTRAARVLAALFGAIALAGPGGLSAQQVDEVGFRPITMEEAVEIALRRNPGLSQARTNIENAEHTRLSAYGALLPSLNLSYGYSNSSSGRIDALGEGIVSTSWSTQISSNLDLFDGWRRFSDLKGAKLGVEEENARYRQTQYQTIQQVKQAYFNAVAARELVGVEERRVQRQRDQLDFVAQQLELGRATRADSLTSQVDLNNARLALLTAENNARTTTFRLTEVVGSETRVGPEEEATLVAQPLPFSRDQLFAVADLSAPTLQTASAATEAAAQAVSSAQSMYLPNLALSAGWGWSNQEFPPQNRSWSISLRGSYPLFNGFSRETAVYRAKAQEEIAVDAERAARLNLNSELEASYSTAQAAQAGIDLAEQNVALSEESLRVVQERYRLGLATILELQDAQIQLTQSEVDLVSRRFEYLLALAAIEALLGRGVEDF